MPEAQIPPYRTEPSSLLLYHKLTEMAYLISAHNQISTSQSSLQPQVKNIFKLRQQSPQTAKMPREISDIKNVSAASLRMSRTHPPLRRNSINNQHSSSRSADARMLHVRFSPSANFCLETQYMLRGERYARGTLGMRRETRRWEGVTLNERLMGIQLHA
jgi:hypothetical protein